MSRLSGGLANPRAQISIANANEIDHKVNDADLEAFMASIPAFEADLVTV